MKIALASDHRGYRYKERIKKILEGLGHTLQDFGTFSEAPADYPDFAFKVAESVSRGDCDRAILICYSGIGMTIAANKVDGIRAALCYDHECIKLSRAHNNANILVLPAKLDFGEKLTEMIQSWIDLPFEGGRHERRLEKVSKYETDK
ncbi:ribose 5-phosphate isomerase B [candidate division TA06 bacterium]|uniref:Ribose 5-phosphate isomerase B n=1 Tax=candidate division TA06 bacterium TaxID=2250710 RepID=A0A523UWC4_UNCT6|nr:MAG: ribose 5-phosphate isomerase B [candidate division TA06 bacterium]